MKRILSQTQEQLNNLSILNASFDPIDGRICRSSLLVFCKRARIDVAFELIDEDVKDSFLKYYGYYPTWSANNDCFILN